MSRVRRWTVWACLLLAAPARADEGEEIALDQLPQQVTDFIQVGRKGVEPLRAWKVVEGDKACYIVSVEENGEVVDWYASADGMGIVRKRAFSLTRWLVGLPVAALVLLLPGAVAGAGARAIAQAARDRTLSVRAGWLSAWVGAAVGLALVLFSFPRGRHTDVLVIGAYCVVGGAVSASLVEAVALRVQSIRGSRARSRRPILGCCAAFVASLALLIPVHLLAIERENNDSKKVVMRPLPGG